jgi:hypothetical protein
MSKQGYHYTVTNIIKTLRVIFQNVNGRPDTSRNYLQISYTILNLIHTLLVLTQNQNTIFITNCFLYKTVKTIKRAAKVTGGKIYSTENLGNLPNLYTCCVHKSGNRFACVNLNHPQIISKLVE